MMKRILAYAALLSALPAGGQETGKSRNGFFFGMGLGAGALSLRVQDTASEQGSRLTLSLPNLKFGYMLNEKLGLCVILPGANYRYQGKDRGFESFTLAGQYFFRNRYWAMGGIGLTADMPAFYTVKDPKTAGFYFGAPSLTAAAGWELVAKKNFRLDAQYRFFYGKSTLPAGYRSGISNMLLLGINWY